MNLAIISFDAGAAEIISAWVRRQSNINFTAYLGGPALKIFKRKCPKIVYKSIEEALSELQKSKPDRLLTGASWGTQIEKESWKLAQRMDISSYAVFDGYGDFESGLNLNGKRVEPSFALVFHQVAEERLKALGLIPERILLRRNFFVEDMKEKFKKIKEAQPLNSEKTLLYICENISTCEATYKDSAGELRGYDEFEALDYFLKKMREQTKNPQMDLVSSKPNLFKNISKINIRPHPSDAEGKYQKIPSRFIELPIEISSCTQSLDEALAKCSVVVGCESQALGLASDCNIETVSCIPPNAKTKCRLPHSKIIHL